MPTYPTDPDLADFLDECGWRSTTLTNACYVLRAWEKWLAAHDVTVMAANHRHLRAWQAEREEAGIAAATRHKEWQTIRAVYAWAARPTGGWPDAKKGTVRARAGAGMLEADPMLRVAEPYVSPTPTVRFASEVDVATLEDYFGHRARKVRGRGVDDGEYVRARRNAAMVSLMFRSGCRVGELCWIDLHHLVRDERDVIVACRVGGDDGAHTKAGKARLVPIRNGTRQLLERYLRRRGKASGPLFLGRAKHTADIHGRLSSKAIQQVVTRAAAACGVALSAHDMRRGWAVQSKRAGVQNLDIRTVAGWESDRMLARYLGPERLRLAVEAFHAADAGDGEPVRRLRSV